MADKVKMCEGLQIMAYNSNNMAYNSNNMAYTHQNNDLPMLKNFT